MNWFVIVAPCSGSWSCNVWSVYTKLDEFSLVLNSFTRSNHRLSSVATSLRTIFFVSFVGQARSRTIKLLRKNGLRRKLLVLTWLQVSCRKLRGTQMMIISSPSRREELRAGGARCWWVTVTHLNAPECTMRKEIISFCWWTQDLMTETTGSTCMKKIIEMFCF